MRLLDTSTQTLVEFANPPDEYAILSHTWGKEEVTFEDITSDKKYWKDGWDKIVNCCELAKRDGWDYVWIDTCCIDKSSSADLSEAINSMFSWYESASVCYAFLQDVDRSQKYLREQVAKSRWFTRGWTLQELIAPMFVSFLDCKWRNVGNRNLLASAIEEGTKIRREDLEKWQECSIATKMSWAAHRATTRVEDEAYCLMGLFKINMPLLYGEGKSAFVRLQHEIIRGSDDESIFAWRDLGALNFAGTPNVSGLLAASPRCFADAAGIAPRRRAIQANSESEYRITNKGLSICLTLWTREKEETFAIMNCRKSSTKSRVAVVLREQQDGSFVRTRRYQLAEIDSSQIPNNELQNRRVYVRDPSVSFRNAKSSLRSYFPVFRNNTVDYELSFPIQYRPSNGHFIKGLGHMISPENFTPDFPEAYRPLSAFSLESRHPTADEQTEEVEATFLCAPPSEWRPLDWDIVFIRSRHDRRICATLVIFRTERSVRVGFVRHHKGCNMSWVMEKLRNTVASTEEDPSVLLSDLSVVLSDTGSRILTRRSVMRAGLSASPNLMTMGPEMKTVVVDISSEACGQKPIIGIYTHEGSLEEDITPSSSDDDEFRHLRCASTETFREMNTQMATIKRRERGLGLIAWIGGYQLVNSDKLPVFTA